MRAVEIVGLPFVFSFDLLMINSVRNYFNRTPLSPAWLGILFGLLSFLLRIPFLFRYDLHYGGDPAIGYLMELRILHGDRPLYFYAQNYMGALEPYFGALFMKWFGPSIPLAGALGLFQWSAAVGIFVFLFTQSTSKFEGFLAGLFCAISVPYTLTYMTQPFTGNASNIFITSLIVLATVSLLNQGGSVFRLMVLGFASGFGLFLNPQTLIGSAACFFTLCLLKTPRWNLLPAFRPRFMGALITGFLLGDAPDLWYKLHHAPTNNHFINIATPYFMMRNLESTGKCVLAYFDAHPLSRVSDGIYFWLKIIDQSRPEGFFDDLFLILAFAVLILIGFSFRESFKNKNAVSFLFSALVLVNLLAIILSARTNADTLNTRRYLTPSAILFSIWTSVLFAKGLEKKSKIIPILTLCFISLFLGRTTFHSLQLLRAPDQLREMRWALEEMNQSGLTRGLSDWPFCDILTSLSNQQIIFAQYPGVGKIPDYQNEVAHSNKIAVVETNEEKPEPVINLGNSKFRLDGAVVKNDTFRIAPYLLIK